MNMKNVYSQHEFNNFSVNVLLKHIADKFRAQTISKISRRRAHKLIRNFDKTTTNNRILARVHCVIVTALTWVRTCFTRSFFNIVITVVCIMAKKQNNTNNNSNNNNNEITWLSIYTQYRRRWWRWGKERRRRSV